MYKNKVAQSFRDSFKVGDVVEGHSTCKNYLITAIEQYRWLGVDLRGRETVRTMDCFDKWRIPAQKEREQFIAEMKQRGFYGF